MKHPDFTTLFELVSGTLPPTRGAEVKEHLSGCAACSLEMQTAGRLLETVQADRLTEPPRSVLARAIALWKTERPGAVRRAVRAMKAVLTFDSFAAPALASVRSGETSRRTARFRRLVYRAGDYDIELAIERSTTPRGRPSIRGQVLNRHPARPLPPGAGGRLGKTGGRIVKLPVDPEGAFASGPIAPGRYRLSLDVGDSRLVVERLEVR